MKCSKIIKMNPVERKHYLSLLPSDELSIKMIDLSKTYLLELCEIEILDTIIDISNILKQRILS